MSRKILVPEYMTKFKCIGPDCEDSCCEGFSYIDIDKNTYQKYKKIKEKPLKNLIKHHVSLNSQNKQDAEYFAKINVLADGTCPFFSKEKLCTIQIEKSEGYLSNHCGSFPRISNEINGRLEKSAAMSCPEAVRLALFNPDGIEFIEIDEKAPFQNLFKAIIDTTHPSFAQTPIKYINELRRISLDILKDRRYHVWERLVLLGHFVEKAGASIEENKLGKVNELISEFLVYKNHTEEIKKDLSDLSDFSSSSEVQFVILTHIIGKKLLSGFDNTRYLECFNDFLMGLKYEPSKELDEMIGNYENSYKNYYFSFMKEHEYILENYLVNSVFRNGFPALTKKTIFDEYVILVIHYSLIKMHLIGMSGYHKQLTDELIVKLIQSLAKTFEHNHQYIEEVHQFLKSKGLNTFKHMVLLIKN